MVKLKKMVSQFFQGPNLIIPSNGAIIACVYIFWGELAPLLNVITILFQLVPDLLRGWLGRWVGSRVGFRSPNNDNARNNTVCEDTCAKRLLELFDFLIIDFFYL